MSGHKAPPAMLYLWTDKVTMPDTFKSLKKLPILPDLTPINAYQLCQYSIFKIHTPICFGQNQNKGFLQKVKEKLSSV